MPQSITRFLRPRSATTSVVAAHSHKVPLLFLAFFLAIFSSTLAIAKEDISTDNATKVQVQETYGKLPLYFIQNDGQMDERVKFYEKGNGHTTLFTKEGVYLSLSSGNSKQNLQLPHPQPEQQSQETLHSNESSDLNPVRPELVEGQMKEESTNKSPKNLSTEVVKLTFLDANPNPEIITEGIQEGKVNYFIGNDPKKWKSNIPTHQAVIYKEVYPGIDIKFYGNNRKMEYDIIVKSGADPSKVHFAYEGIEGLRVIGNGDLEIVLKEGSILQKKPVIYQEIDGKRVMVDGRFVISGDKGSKQSQILPSPLMGEGMVGVTSVRNPQFTYAFEVAAYDKKSPLIIDPTLSYATYLGGSGHESNRGFAVDGSGNAYITGSTTSLDFPTTVGAYDTTYNGGYIHNTDVFLVKLNTTGSALSYATYLGGSSDEDGGSIWNIAVDGFGNAFVTGGTYSIDFPTTPGAFDIRLIMASGMCLWRSSILRARPYPTRPSSGEAMMKLAMVLPWMAPGMSM